MNTDYGFDASAFEASNLPDVDTEFVDKKDIEEFARALNAPEAPSVIALNDWRPINQRVKKKGLKARRRKPGPRSKDETREGFVYTLLKWPLLLVVLGWIIALGLWYLVTRLYIWAYERLITWRGQRQRLRDNVRSKTNFEDWKRAALALDKHLGNEEWKQDDDYAYYDSSTARKVTEQLKAGREKAEAQKDGETNDAVHKLRNLVEACVKNNFVGVENPRLYSETYYGTKRLAQAFVDELHDSLAYLLHSSQLSQSEKYNFAKHLHTNLGRTAFCLSGGASFAWYHFGVVKALLDASLLPDVVTGSKSSPATGQSLKS